MLFMGTELAHYGWWAPDADHGTKWELAEDNTGKAMLAFFSAANGMRWKWATLRKGWCNILHEDRQNGVLGFDRVYDGEERCICVLNAGQNHWAGKEYGLHVGDGRFEQIFCSSDSAFEPDGSYLKEAGATVCNKDCGVINALDGKIFINLPVRCSLIFKQVYA